MKKLTILLMLLMSATFYGQNGKKDFLTMKNGKAYLFEYTQSSQNLVLSEDFEDNKLESIISVEKKGSFNSEPGIKNITNFGSTKAFGFGRSTCGANCFGNYTSTLKVELPQETFISSISFKEMELYGAWGSSGYVYIDGKRYGIVIGQGGNTGVADTKYREHKVIVDTLVKVIEFRIVDITNASEIFMDDLEIYGKVKTCNFGHYWEVCG